MAARTSRKELKSNRRLAPKMTQPAGMKTKSYVYGVEKLNGNDAWALFEASAQGDLDRVKALLERDPRLANAQYWYQFPLHMAVFAGHAQVVKLLLEKGADPGQSIYTYNSWDKLLLAARERGYDKIESLLVRAMQKRFKYSPEFDVLKDAVIARDARAVNAVLRRRPELACASDALGNNPLHWCVITRQLSLIDRFVELGTPIDALRADGQSPVLLAVNGPTDYWYRATRGRSHPTLRNTSVLVGSLIAHGAKYSISVAAAVGDQERVEELLREDASLARRLDSARISPLSYAAQEGHLHIVRLLLEHGADPNMPEEAAPYGRALYEACCANNLAIAQLLLERGANPNTGVDSSECCFTIGTVYHGDQAKPLQDLLSRYGAYMPPYRLSLKQMKQAIRDGDAVSLNDEFLEHVLKKHDPGLLELYLDSHPTALQQLDFDEILAYPRSTSLVRTLLARGLDPNESDWMGNTVLHACAENGDRSAAALLLDSGAEIDAREVEFQGTPLAAAVRCCAGSDDPKQATRGRQMVKFLLDRGAAVSLQDDQEWATPLAWARKKGLVEVEQMLLQQTAH